MTATPLRPLSTDDIGPALVRVLLATIALTLLGSLRVLWLGQGPIPAPLLYLAFQVAGIPSGVWLVAGPFLLLLWSPELLIGARRIPLRSTIGLGLLSLLAAYHVWASWDYSVFHRGWLGTLGVLTVTTLPLVPLWMLHSAARAQPTAWRNLLFHVGVVAWLVTLAYPDTVELP